MALKLVTLEESTVLFGTTTSRLSYVVNFPAPLCRLWEYGSSAVRYDLRCWVPNEAFWDVKLDLNERVFTNLRKHGVEIPFEQLDVHLKDERVQNGEER